MVEEIERFLTTPDRRQLRVVEAGRPDGIPVLMQHGTPATGDLFAPHVQDALDKGIRLISYDRPGYGGSSRHAGYTPADSANDVRTIALTLGIDRLAIWGISGGGPHTLACAALLPDLVAASCTLASPAPYGAPGLDYFSGMAEPSIDEIKLSLEDEANAFARVPADREEMLSMTVEAMEQRMERRASDADASVHNHEFAEWLVGSMHASVAVSGDGWWDDGMSQLRPWGFDLESILVPIQMWHGRKDTFVPVAHGEWLATHIPGVEAHITEEDGHGSLLQYRIPEVHRWLIDRFD